MIYKALINSKAQISELYSKEGYFFFIDVLKIVAILLILNSHMDTVYPIKKLATGGALGNSLFFISSGFLIQGKKKDIKFFLNVFSKIYIPLYIVMSFGGLDENVGIFKQLIWPTNFWFIGAIVLFYFCSFIFEKIRIYEYYVFFIVVLVTVYFSIYFFVLDTSFWVVESIGLDSIEGLFKLIYYLGIYTYGGKIRKDFCNERKTTNALAVSWIPAVIVMYLLMYFMKKNNDLYILQFVCQICTVIFAISFFEFVRSICKRVDSLKVKRIITMISRLSIEIYLVQGWAISHLSFLQFPINLILIVLLVIFISAIIKIACNFIHSLLHNEVKNAF